jgi:hypothetical protein
MDIKVLMQPYRGSTSAAQTFITTALEDDAVTDVLMVVAWLRASGLSVLVPGLQALRSRGGRSRLLFGIDLEGTSRQGVAIARRQFTTIHAVHDPSGRTFHPKLYLATGKDVGYALIGSNNLTAGGLWHNYEAALMATFDPRQDQQIADGIRGYARRVLSDRPICKRVTQDVLDRLLAEGFLADETRDQRLRNEDRLDKEVGKRHQKDPLFRASAVQKRGTPAPTRSKVPRRQVPSSTRRRLATARDTWWKRLEAGDAQHPPTGHRTGNVALTNVPPDQDRKTFFRRVFFGAETWHREIHGGKRSELTHIDVEVSIGRRNLGQHRLTVVYRAYRAERGRATTILRWGDQLLAELERRELTGWYLLIERADLQTYRLRVIKQTPA